MTPLKLDAALLAAWRDHPGHIAETRAVVADWHARVVATPAEATPTGPWLALRLAIVLAELDAFTAAIDEAQRLSVDAAVAAMEEEFRQSGS